MNTLAHVGFGLLLLALVGCGGGDGGSGTTLTFDPSTDLTLFSDGSTDAAFTALNAGDTNANLGLRVGLRFGLFPFIPAGATVTSAYLHLRQTGSTGNPFTTLGTVVVDRVDFGLTLAADDFSPTVLTSGVTTASDDATPGVREINVTAAVAADVAAGALASDFLLRFTGSNPHSDAEFVKFEDSENAAGTGDVPKLVVTYH